MNPAARQRDPGWIETEAEKIYYFVQANVIRPAGLLRDLLKYYNTSTTRKDIDNNTIFESHFGHHIVFIKANYYIRKKMTRFLYKMA